MSSSTITLLLLAVPILAVLGVQQRITFFTERDQMGESVTFLSNQNDLAAYSDIMNRTASYCGHGIWYSFDKKNFLGKGFFHGQTSTEDEEYCFNIVREYTESLRHFGSSDTSTPALSLYESTFMGAREIYVTDLATDFPFNPQSYVTSGRSDWTFFEGANYEGPSICKYAGVHNLRYNNNITAEAVVRSVVKGCGEEAVKNLALYRQESS